MMALHPLPPLNPGMTRTGCPSAVCLPTRSGVAATSVERSLFGFFDDTDAVRLNALVCGLIFVALGRELRRRGLKPHFEPAAAHACANDI